MESDPSTPSQIKGGIGIESRSDVFDQPTSRVAQIIERHRITGHPCEFLAIGLLKVLVTGVKQFVRRTI